MKIVTWLMTGAVTAALITAFANPAHSSPEIEAQNWYGNPVLPSVFEEQEPQERQDDAAPEFLLPLPMPPRSVGTSRELPSIAESDFPKLLSVFDFQDWRDKDQLRLVRQFAGDALFGVPLLIPQLLMEELIPRGLAIGPTTFLYKDSKDSRTMPLVVFDQTLFHEGEFLAQAQSENDGLANSANLTSTQRHVLRRSLMNGFRATYALPSMSMDLILETAAEQGIWGYLLAPAAGGALLFFKCIDQRISIKDVVKARIQLSSGRQWLRASHSEEGLPALDCELKFANFPIGVIVSFEMTNHGMTTQFVGIGTSLDVVHNLLSVEEMRTQRPNE